MSTQDQPADINFFKGHPSFRLLPGKQIAEAAKELLTPDIRDFDDDTRNRHPLTYGSDEGALWVRETICHFNNDEAFRLSPGDRARSKPEHLNLNSGASYGVLSILLETTLAHTGYTRQAFVITPTYFLINDCFIDAGFANKTTAIDELGDGKVDLDSLEKKLEELEKQHEGQDDSKDLELINNPWKSTHKKVYRYVLYCIPTFANPSGQTYTLETRRRLIEIARKYDMLILADDVYDMLDYEQNVDKSPQPIKRFVHLDRETNEDPNSFGNTISNATFSKLIAPGLRFGYHESITQKLVFQLSQGGANTSGGTPSQLNSMIVGTMLKNGSAYNVLATLRAAYKQRAIALRQAVITYLPKGTQMEPVKGGYFGWVTLPLGYDAKEIGQRLKSKYGVVLADGSNFEVVGDTRNWGQRSVRISISFLETQDIEKGIELWGQVCKEFAAEKSLY
ncbi:hypothetical protein ZYGR_0H03050 [Zygosaccharomyces rouxii]|uniref:ZYRO0B11088p n=2 Tax=Zygosaccharomyces rouxii TaxID=4956 RepID=C5DRT1_ZYGRC|nr:uncharacterized protein ZYRO0B11088g [Zygosaccharomyces rouxii]KAH9199975.1 pyridoxal phosphate-dependent transferase [Zygosaccharomyces rouxii]GAV47462.1 hypothetical protein ZYGR_0H03050 [Zygosaccharomyces rouxii]CAR26492.1 ZYRO0B11088p [Zygosaccharomyces rouxii]